MEKYPVKAVTRLTGLTPETLRAWERRYSAVTPRRDDAGRRLYSHEDVERLRAFKRLVDAGHPISRVVGMADDERDRLLLESEREAPGDDLAALRTEILTAALEYDAAALENKLGLVMATVAADRVVDEVIGPVLVAVGRAWQFGELDIAQERLVSSVVRARILTILRNSPDLDPAILLATPSGERHELGLLLFAFRAASRLVPLRYLGPDLPLGEIRRLADRFRPRVVALSLVNEPGEAFLDELDLLTGDGFQVWLGGRGAESLAGRTPKGCRLLRDAQEIGVALDELANRP